MNTPEAIWTLWKQTPENDKGILNGKRYIKTKRLSDGCTIALLLSETPNYRYESHHEIDGLLEIPYFPFDGIATPETGMDTGILFSTAMENK